MKAITAFVADRTYYDFKYLSNKAENPVFVSPFDVYMQKRTICQGFSNFTRTLLVSLGIPCMNIYGKDHAYNAAYDSAAKRWRFINTTWCSSNRYTERGEWVYGGFSYINFGLEPSQVAILTNHEVYWVEGLLDQKDNSAYYRLETKGVSDADYKNTVWSDCDWHLSLAGAKKDAVKAVRGFGGMKVIDIAEYGFWESGLKKIDLSAIPVKEIGKLAFAGCGLESAAFPETLSKIGESAFLGCKNLKSAKFSLALSKMGENAFMNCSKLQKADLSKAKVTKLPRYAFAYCSKLAEVKFPPNLKEVGFGSFYGCSKLKEVDLYGTKTAKIQEAAFEGCRKSEDSLGPG